MASYDLPNMCNVLLIHLPPPFLPNSPLLKEQQMAAQLIFDVEAAISNAGAKIVALKALLDIS